MARAVFGRHPLEFTSLAAPSAAATDAGAVMDTFVQRDTVSTSHAALSSNGKADLVLDTHMPPTMLALVESKVLTGKDSNGRAPAAANGASGSGRSEAAPPLTTPRRFCMETLRGRGSRPVNVVAFVAPTAQLEAVGLAAAEASK